MARGPLLSADMGLDHSLVGRGPRGLTEFCADLGNLQVALPVLALAILYVLRRGRRVPSAPLDVPRGAVAHLRRRRGWSRGSPRPHGALPLATALAMAAVPAVVVPLKALIDRPSPLDPAETGYFPSGHGATAAVAYCGAALLLRAGAGGRWPAAVAFVLTATTGIGLVLRGYHWPLDVLGSWCLSVLLLAPAWWLSRRAAAGSPPRASRAPGAPGR
ncbi:phosphatase PAP2 family protein [Streptomyces sp. NPDC021093]|uniref:phosphatase PAP2 family protein n=1 Tax=Streptomyces sp. NPDC021093 TaxID=3365112 RepID=UPI0037AD3BBC